MIHAWGEPDYRATQIWHGLYKNLWDSPDLFTNLPREFRYRLDDSFKFRSLEPGIVLELHRMVRRPRPSSTFQINNPVEAVLMRYNQRRTLCISTQAGCAMACVFCATGQMGFRRNLSSGEIVEQVHHYAKLLKSSDEHVTNIVVMGMGEPFHNYDDDPGCHRSVK